MPILRSPALCHPSSLSGWTTGRPSGVGYFPRTQRLGFARREALWDMPFHLGEVESDTLHLELVNHVLGFPAVLMNGSLSTWDMASDAILFPREWGVVGKHILFTRCFGFRADTDKKSGSIHKIEPEPFYLQFH